MIKRKSSCCNRRPSLPKLTKSNQLGQKKLSMSSLHWYKFKLVSKSKLESKLGSKLGSKLRQELRLWQKQKQEQMQLSIYAIAETFPTAAHPVLLAAAATAVAFVAHNVVDQVVLLQSLKMYAFEV